MPGSIDAFEQRAGIALPRAYRTFLELHDGWRGLGAVALFDLNDQQGWRDRLIKIDPAFTLHAIGVDRSLGGILCLELSKGNRNDAPVVVISEDGVDVAFESFDAMLSSTLLGGNMQPKNAGPKSARGARPKKSAPKARVKGKTKAAAKAKAAPKKKATPKTGLRGTRRGKKARRAKL